MKKRTLVIVLAILTGCACSAFANDSIGTSTVNFLKIGTGARPSGMGGAFVAVADDINAIYWNPAGLSQSKNIQITATHLIWFEDITNEYLGLSVPLEGGSAVGGSINYINLGTAEGRSSTGVDLGNVSAYDMAIDGFFSHTLKNFAFGCNVKGLYEKLGSSSAPGVAFDLGLLGIFRPMSLGLCIQNIGPDMKIDNMPDKLPLNIKTGLAFQSSGLTVAVDVDAPRDYDLKYHVGAEYCIAKLLALRLGYEKINKLNNSGLTAGIGLNSEGVSALEGESGGTTKETKIAEALKAVAPAKTGEQTAAAKTETAQEKPEEVKWSIDYALRSFGDFGYTHTISLTIGF